MVAIACGVCLTPWDLASDAELCEETCNKRIKAEAVFYLGQRIHHKDFKSVPGSFYGTFTVTDIGIDEDNELFYIVENSKGEKYPVPSSGLEIDKWVSNFIQYY